MTPTTTSSPPSLTMIEQAWAAVPQYDDLTARLAQARTLQIPELSIADAQQRFLDSAIAAGTVTPAMLAALQDAQTQLQAVELAHNTIVSGRLDLERQITHVQRSGADQALTFLHSQLARLVDGLRPHTSMLSRVKSADDAIAAGPDAVKAWTAVTDAVGSYGAIRHAQATVTIAGYGGSLTSDAAKRASDDLARFGIVRDSRDYPPLSTLESGSGILRIAPGTESIDFGEQPWPPVSYGVLHLAWALAEGAALWVPTTKELRAVAAEHAQATRTARTDAVNAVGAGPDGFTSQSAVDAAADRYQREVNTIAELEAAGHRVAR